MGGGLSTVCACGHMACFHPSLAQQADYRAGSEGRYSGECKGGMQVGAEGRACRCITDRESIAAARNRRSGATEPHFHEPAGWACGPDCTDPLAVHATAEPSRTEPQDAAGEELGHG